MTSVAIVQESLICLYFYCK